MTTNSEAPISPEIPGAFRAGDIDQVERQLREILANLQREYEKAARPFIRELVKIEMIRRPEILFVRDVNGQWSREWRPPHTPPRRLDACPPHRGKPPQRP